MNLRDYARKSASVEKHSYQATKYQALLKPCTPPPNILALNKNTFQMTNVA